VYEAVEEFLDDFGDDRVTILSPVGETQQIEINESFALIRRDVSSQVKLANIKG